MTTTSQSETQTQILLPSINLQNFKEIKQGLIRRIASVTSYLFENEAKNLQICDVHLAQIPDLGMGYLENHLAD